MSWIENKIFCLSLKKNGTTTLHKLFKKNHLTSVHGGNVNNWCNNKRFKRFDCIIYAKLIQ